MKAALCKNFDGPAGVVVEDIPKPAPGSGEILVRVRAAALNFFDTLITRNTYQYKPSLPFSPCAEFAGEVAEIGEGVRGFEPGQRVLAYTGWNGCREFAIARPDQLVRVPDAVSDAVAAGVTVTYGTGMHGLKDRGRLKPGETLAVLGASGGAGLAALEIGKRMGARVIAVASTLEKLEICAAHGADELVNYKQADLKDALKALTGGKGVDVVYDCVGGPHAEAALRATGWEGRYLVVGFAAGEIPRLPLNLVLLKGCEIVGVFWGEFLKRDPQANRANIEEVLAWCASGELRPHIHGSFGIEDIVEALMTIEERRATGKVIVTI